MFPVLTLGSVELSSYTLMMALAGCVGFWRTAGEAERGRLSPPRMLAVAAAMFVAALLGARALSLLLHWPLYLRQEWWSALAVWDRGGLAFYGGLLLAGAVGLAGLRVGRLPRAEAADRLVLAWLPALVLVRLGCFLNGCCYGKPTTSALGIVAGGSPSAVNFGIPSHPTQLYDAAALALVFAIARLMRDRRAFAGQLAVAFLALHSAARFVEEPLRGDPRGPSLGGLTLNQAVALVLLALSLLAAAALYAGGGVLAARRRSRIASTPATPSGSA
jgi:phosphatidylglycerol:prolipoprotein diacylglycerol transferase